MAKTSLNIEENMASLLCYIGTWVTGLIFIIVEKENKTVKFHAWQSFLTFLPLVIVAPILGYIGAPSVSWGPYYTYNYNPGIPALVWASWAIYAVIFIIWLIMIIKAYQGEKFKLPVIGDIAEKQANK